MDTDINSTLYIAGITLVILSFSILASLFSSCIRYFIYKSAFQGMSRNCIKKVRRLHPLWYRLTLLYVLRYKNQRKTFWLFVGHWLYWLYSIVLLLGLISLILYNNQGVKLGVFEVLWYIYGTFSVIVWAICMKSMKY